MAASCGDDADTNVCSGAGATATLMAHCTTDIVMSGPGRRCEVEDNWQSTASQGVQATGVTRKLRGCGRSEDLDCLPTTHESIPPSSIAVAFT